MKKFLTLFAYCLSFILLGGMASCSDDKDPVGYNVYLDGAYRESGSNGIFVFDGNGIFKYYENDWLYTSDVNSYSFGTWNFSNSTLTLTYTGKYTDGTLEPNFSVSMKNFTFKDYNPNTQSWEWAIENGKTIVFKKYIRANVEQYLKQYIVGKWQDEDGVICNFKADGTFTKTIASIDTDYGVWSISGTKCIVITEGYYDANHNKVRYETPKVLSLDVDPTSNTMSCWVAVDTPPALDQGGGIQNLEHLITWKKIN